MGSSIFFYVPGYKSPVERKIEGFKFYRNLEGCHWPKNEDLAWNSPTERVPDRQCLYLDPSEAKIGDIVSEGAFALKLVHPSGIRTRASTMLVMPDNQIVYYSRSHIISDAQFYIFASYQLALRSCIKYGETLSAATPMKDGGRRGSGLVVI